MLYKRNQPPLSTKKELKNEWLKLFYYLLISLTIIGIFYLIGITIDAICHHYSHQINYLKQLATDELTMPILAGLFTSLVISVSAHFVAKNSLEAYGQTAYFIKERNRLNKIKGLVKTSLMSLFWLIAAPLNQYLTLSIINFFIYRAKHLNQPLYNEQQIITAIKHVFVTQSNILILLPCIYFFILMHHLNKSVKNISQLTPAQALTKTENDERTYGINLAKRYRGASTNQDVVLLLWMYDHVHPNDWIWLNYQQTGTYTKEQFECYLNGLHAHFIDKKDYLIDNKNYLSYSELEKKDSYQKALTYLPNYLNNQSFHLEHIDN
jgi:hypothetical protein